MDNHSEEQTPYQILRSAEQFEESYLGIAAQPSKLVTAFQTILHNEKNADEIFKDLLINASFAGKLYALCGIYFTDHENFPTIIEPFRTIQEDIRIQSGCLGFGKPFSEIVEAKTSNAIRLPDPHASLFDWRRNHPEANTPDIIGGGYPHMFGETITFSKPEMPLKG